MKKGLKIILGLVLVVGLVFGGLFVALSIPKTAGVEYSEEDLQAYLDNTGVKFHENNASAEDILFEDYSSSGSIAVEGTLTSEQASALANEVINPKSILRNIQIKFAGEDKVIASATIGDNLGYVYSMFPTANEYKSVLETVRGKSVYIETSLSHVEDNTFFAEIQKIHVGLVPFPTNAANDYGTEVGTVLNRVLNNMNGLDVESFKIDGDGLHFKGSIPEETQSLSND